MIKIKFANRFKKELELMQKRGKNPNKIAEIIKLLELDAKLPKKYKDHRLQGKFSQFRECHIEPDWLLIYRIEGDSIIFERTGTHSDLFK